MNAPWNHGRRGSALREPFAAFVCDDETAEGIRPILNEIGWPVEAINKGGLRNAINTLSVSASPSVLVVDLSESGDPINDIRSEEHTSELQSLMRISYAVFCLKKKKQQQHD